MVHERLEGRWAVAETKEHDGRFKESERSNECSLLLVFFTDADIVKSPLDVKLGKYRGVFHVVDQFRDEGQGVCIADGMRVQVMIILAGAERTVLLCNKEERSGLWGLGWNDLPGLKVFVNKHLACLLFLWVERVYLRDLRNEQGFKVYGVVVGSVGRENIMGLLREYVFEV